MLTQLRINEIILGFMAITSEWAAILFLYFADNSQPSADVQIWGSSRLLALSMVGSSVGALMSIMTVKAPDQASSSPRALAFGFLCSMSCGVVFAPMVMEWSGIAKREDMILPFSALSAFMAIRLARAISPVIETIWMRKFKKILDVDETHESDKSDIEDKGQRG